MNGPAVAGGLVARTRAIEGAPRRDLDLLGVAGASGVVWVQGRHGLAGRGIAGWITVPGGAGGDAAAAVHQALAAIEVDDQVDLPGTGPVALGALPFDPHHDGRLVIPAVLAGRSPDGTTWLTTVGPPEAPAPDPTQVLAELSAPDRSTAHGAAAFEVRAARPPDEWQAMVGEVRDVLRRERAGAGPSPLRKVVLAREVLVEADAPLDAATILARLRTGYPTCTLFRTAGSPSLVGASPELLVARLGDRVAAHPLAGTTPRSGDPAADAAAAAALIASTKDQEEHRITIDMVHDTLLPWCSYLDEEAEPSIVAMANVSHLGTRVEGRLAHPVAHVMELVAALHPTPAVGGSPRDRALELIAEVEQLDRGCYAGPVGWVDRHGNGEWAVAIRCAEIHGARARLFAGVGVLPDSDPEAELAETRAKLQPLLTAIIRP